MVKYWSPGGAGTSLRAGGGRRRRCPPTPTPGCQPPPCFTSMFDQYQRVVKIVVKMWARRWRRAKKALSPDTDSRLAAPPCLTSMFDQYQRVVKTAVKMWARRWRRAKKALSPDTDARLAAPPPFLFDQYQIVVKMRARRWGRRHRSNSGQIVVKLWSNCGQIVAK